MIENEDAMIETKKIIIPDGIPVNPDLTSKMLIDIAVNKNSDVWVFHDKPFPELLQWAEYDIDDGRLVFITKGGMINDFGLEIQPLMRKYLRKADTIDIILVYDQKIQDYGRLKLITRNTTH